MSQPMNQPPKRQIGPPHIVELARAEAFKEIVLAIAEREPELVAEVIEAVRGD